MSYFTPLFGHLEQNGPSQLLVFRLGYMLQVGFTGKMEPPCQVGFLYLNDTAPARCCLHRIQEDGLGVLAATREDDTAPPATGRSRRDALRRAVAAQPVSISITLRHVVEKEGSI